LADRANEGHSSWRDDAIANGTTDPNRQDPACATCNITNRLNSTHPDIVLLHTSINAINDSGGTSSSLADHMHNLLCSITHRTHTAGHIPCVNR